MINWANFNTKLFADGAERDWMLEMKKNPFIRGFTTNPTLMRKAGVADYKTFALEILEGIKDLPISFEVIGDEFDEMERQAKMIASWGQNVYVKIPITNTRGESSIELLKTLSKAGVKVNVTAIMTLAQVRDVAFALADGMSAYASVFAGRIADSGKDPVPVMAAAVEILRPFPNIELIWASPREIFNVIQAEQVGCHIITATNDILKKLDLIGKDLNEFSLETVKMFRNDAIKTGYIIT